MERRDFLVNGGILAAGAFASSALISCKTKDRLKKTTSFMEKVPAIVIGSGYGGAVSALRLTEAGVPVTLLEMGMKWERTDNHNTFCKMITADKRSSWLSSWPNSPITIPIPIKKYTGVLDKIEYGDMSVFAGRAYGGGSIVNGGISIPPRKSYVEEIFPNLDSKELFDRFIPLVNNELSVQRIPQEFYNSTKYYQFTRAAEEQAHKAGLETEFFSNTYDFDYMQREAKGEVYKSALGGEVIYGNNAGKFSLDQTYLKKAEETGLLTVKTLRKVDRILQQENGEYVIEVDVLSTDGSVIRKEVYKTDKLFLNAGSTGTSEILVKAKHNGDLNRLNDHVGKYWGPNGNIMTGRNFVKAAGLKQSTIPIKGINMWSDDYEYRIFAEIAPLPMGIETWTTLFLSISDNRERAKFYYDEGSGTVKLNWRKEQNEYSRKAAEHLLKKLKDSNNGTRSRLLFNNGYGDDFTYHPLGGGVLGKVTDMYGRVKGYDGLYINDGSLIPGSAGVNPFVFITSLAERNMDTIMRDDFELN